MTNSPIREDSPMRDSQPVGTVFPAESNVTYPSFSPEQILAIQSALNLRVKNLKRWILENTRAGKNRSDGLADLEQAHAKLMNSIMEAMK